MDEKAVQDRHEKALERARQNIKARQCMRAEESKEMGDTDYSAVEQRIVEYLRSIGRENEPTAYAGKLKPREGELT